MISPADATAADTRCACRLKTPKWVDSPVKSVTFKLPLGAVDPDLSGIDWVIIGVQTNPDKQPKPEQVQFIMEKAGRIPIFITGNLDGTPALQGYPVELVFR